MRSLKETLDIFYREYNFRDRLKHDPVEFPHRYSTSDDIEIAGFIASSFAYGRIDLFKPVIERILKPGGIHPASFIWNFNLKKDSKYFRGISYRFNREEDILCFIYMLSAALRKWGSLRNLFYHNYRPDDKDIQNALTGFISFFLSINTSPIYKKNIKPHGLNHFFPSPEKGSACKRLNLFLRWMVRNKDVDLGAWDKIPPSKLIIPLDTHIARISQCLGLTRRKAADWKTAMEITTALREMDPQDPIKYDFALCHHGISGLCKGKGRSDVCSTCALSFG